MCTHATSCIGETSLQNCQKTKESLGNIGIFLLLKPNFPHMKFNFLQRLFAFFNGFQLSSKAFWFSSRAFQFSSRAFHFPRNPRKSIYGEKYTKDHYLSFVFFATCSPACSPSFVIPATIHNSRECTRENCTFVHPRKDGDLKKETVSAIGKHFLEKRVGWFNEWHFLKVMSELPENFKQLMGGKDGCSSKTDWSVLFFTPKGHSDISAYCSCLDCTSTFFFHFDY